MQIINILKNSISRFLANTNKIKIKTVLIITAVAILLFSGLKKIFAMSHEIKKTLGLKMPGKATLFEIINIDPLETAEKKENIISICEAISEIFFQTLSCCIQNQITQDINGTISMLHEEILYKDLIEYPIHENYRLFELPINIVNANPKISLGHMMILEQKRNEIQSSPLSLMKSLLKLVSAMQETQLSNETIKKIISLSLNINEDPNDPYKTAVFDLFLIAYSSDCTFIRNKIYDAEQKNNLTNQQ